MDIKEKVLEVMHAEGQPLNAGKIAQLGGLDRKEIDKLIEQLKRRQLTINVLLNCQLTYLLRSSEPPIPARGLDESGMAYAKSRDGMLSPLGS